MNEQQVREIILGALQTSGATLDESAEKQWDSLAHIDILVTLDTKFGGKLGDISELQDANSVKAILAVLHSHHLLD